MVDDDFVAAIGPEGCLYGLCYGSTCFYIANYGAVLGFVAVAVLVAYVGMWAKGELASGILA